MIKVPHIKLVTILYMILINSMPLFSQPMSGSYTIGGNNPDFVTLQEAADALNLNGVSSSVFFNIRPGVYFKNGGNNAVLLLDSTVAGLSPSNRITFQPDAAAGGNVNNVILEMNINDVNTADRHIVLVQLDYITFHNLTFQENDSSLHIFNFALVRFQRATNINTVVEGNTFEGCNFIGTAPSGTDQGIQFGQSVGDITIRGNTFTRLLWGIYGADVSGVVQGTLTIEDNQFLAGWRSASGSGNQLGAAIVAYAANMIIRRNIIDFEGSFNGGYQGIFVTVPIGTETIIIEQNTIKGLVSRSLIVQGATGNADTLIIANNMINVIAHPVWANQSAVGLSIVQDPGNVQILFNTVVLHGTTLVGLEVRSENSVVLNNIIIARPSAGFNMCYDQGNLQSSNLQSDYNVIFMLNAGASGPLVVRNGVQYPSLSTYQTATGLDTNSFSKDIEFVDSTNLHISDCQAQDPDLKGIPVAGITVDIDDEIRSTTTPMIGADENSFTGFQMFSDPFRAELPGTAFDIAADNFDNLLFDGLAVPDYDNRQVLLYHNLPPRSFELDNTLQTVFKPVAVKFYDLDEDNNLDLIVGGDTTAVAVFWGDGIGGFSAPVIVETFGRVRSLEPGPIFTSPIKRTIAITQDNGFLPNTSTLGYLMHLGNRDLCHDVQYAQGNIPPDTVHAVMTDFVVGDIAGDGGFPEIAAVTSFPLPHPLILISDIFFLASAGPPCADVVPRGTITEHQLGGVGSTAGQSNIVMGDFDGDTDLDLITLETFSSVKLIKNQGNLNFTSESISATGAMGLAAMDYENDSDLDFITVNDQLQNNGITVFLNDGTGSFISRENCFFPFATGLPRGVVASDFDQDGKTDIAIVSSVAQGVDSLFVLYNLGGGTVGIRDQKMENIPSNFSLSQNYPNPFNPSTRIEYTLPSESNVRISVFNILGEKIKELVNEQKTSGTHTINFNAGSLSSGIYFYRIEAKALFGVENFNTVKKMLLLK